MSKSISKTKNGHQHQLNNKKIHFFKEISLPFQVRIATSCCALRYESYIGNIHGEEVDICHGRPPLHG